MNAAFFFIAFFISLRLLAAEYPGFSNKTIMRECRGEYEYGRVEKKSGAAPGYRKLLFKVRGGAILTNCRARKPNVASGACYMFLFLSANTPPFIVVHKTL